jgi:hypothetical protein
MSAITLISANPYVEGPSVAYAYGSVQIGMSFTQMRTIKSRKTYKWTAKGPQGDRTLCAITAAPGGNWFLYERDFVPREGSEISADPNGDVWGVYFETWEDYTGREYYNWTTHAWVAF